MELRDESERSRRAAYFIIVRWEKMTGLRWKFSSQVLFPYMFPRCAPCISHTLLPKAGPATGCAAVCPLIVLSFAPVRLYVSGLKMSLDESHSLNCCFFQLAS